MRTSRFLEACAALPGMTEDDMPWASPMAGDLVLTYGIEGGETFVAVTAAMMRERRWGPMDLQDRAFANVSRFTRSMEVKSLGPVFQVSMPNDLSAVMYFFDDFWTKTREQLGCAPVAAFAHRNLVAFTGESNATGRTFLEQATRRLPPDDPHALSQYLYCWDEDWVSILREGDASQPRARDVPIAQILPALGGSGAIEPPARVACVSCGGWVEIGKDHFERTVQGTALSNLLPAEQEPFRRAKRTFLASAAGSFVLELRCSACNAPHALGGEVLRPGSFRPLLAWTLEPRARA